ncbi:MAG: PhnD/SsuA/transferrin family substrate-binding protein [Candidatus Latescibacteria bacterium]|nr:PhnD/SsuA/transferrin family substrate-binding protein [Candidatus Latescibacterota bacterium]
MKRFYPILAIALALPMHPLSSHGQTSSLADTELSGVLEVGYTRAMFKGVDVADAGAALRVWVKRIIERTGEEAGSETVVLEDAAHVVHAVRDREVDIVTMLTEEYLQVRDQVGLTPLAVTAHGDGVGHRISLLARKDGRIDGLRQLAGCDLVVDTGGQGRGPFRWLDVLLSDSGLPVTADLLGSVRTVSRASRAVLPVFFGQADVCLVRSGSYATMVELNPQLGSELVVLATSPWLCYAIVCARTAVFELRLKGLLAESLISLHEDPEGRQLLTLFQVDRLLPFDPNHLQAFTTLLGRHRALTQGMASPRRTAQ